MTAPAVDVPMVPSEATVAGIEELELHRALQESMDLRDQGHSDD